MSKKKPLLELLVNVINKREPDARELVECCLNIVGSVYKDQESPKDDVNQLLQDLATSLQATLPKAEG